MSNPTVRILETTEELEDAFTVFRAALLGVGPLPFPIVEVSDVPRTFGGYLDDTLAGTAGGYDTTIVVPGGERLPHLAVTRVGVLPTHTRRGLATALLTTQLADARQRGVPVATLRASEGGIYGRYGYGVAGRAATVEVAPRRAVFRAGVPAGGPLRLLPPANAAAELARIYRAIDPPWVGAMGRPDSWWRLRQSRADAKVSSTIVVHGPPGAEDGFARYHLVDQPHGSSEEVLEVVDLVAANPISRAALLRYLLSVDLIERVQFEALPIDDPLPLLLVDERPVRTVEVQDEIWLRLVDVPAALAARSYRGEGEVVVGVVDRVLPANTGSYAISAAGVKPTNVPAQLTVDVATLATVYLGGTRWWQLIEAGRVAVHEPAVLPAAEELFGTDRAPYCGTFF
jgi:predicted acetyltransferase